MNLDMLDGINSPTDVKTVKPEELAELCREIRYFLVKNVSQTGGHLASNLGVVELTVALHRVFDSTRDRIIFDVGHQSYVHKIFTGRRESFDTLRRFGGISGFPKPRESRHDAFPTGHASTSISAILGFARAAKANNQKINTIAVIGDGSLSGGMAYEALNDAGGSGLPVIVVLNDNGMSISRSVGALNRYLASLRIAPGYIKAKRLYGDFMDATPVGRKIMPAFESVKDALRHAVIPGSFFESMGFKYLGPVDGHNIRQVSSALTLASELNCPVLLHVKTIKGKGYRFSERRPSAYHGVSKFDAAYGCEGKTSDNFSERLGSYLCEIAEKDRRVCAVTAAMCDGTGLKGFKNEFPDRFFDVGITEEHAVTMCAGMALGGLIPVCAIYSTFLQRAYDQIIHDAAISGAHIVFAVDRAGIVGEDGETHHGMFDLSFLSQVPGMTVLAPSNYAELKFMLQKAVALPGLVAVRYPRGQEGEFSENTAENDTHVVQEGKDVTIVTSGILINNALLAVQRLADLDISCELIKVNRLFPLRSAEIERSVLKTGKLLVVEDNIYEGSTAQRLSATLFKKGISCSFDAINLGSNFVTHGRINKLQRLYELDGEGIYARVKKLVNFSDE